MNEEMDMALDDDVVIVVGNDDDDDDDDDDNISEEPDIHDHLDVQTRTLHKEASSNMKIQPLGGRGSSQDSTLNFKATVHSKSEEDPGEEDEEEKEDFNDGGDDKENLFMHIVKHLRKQENQRILKSQRANFLRNSSESDAPINQQNLSRKEDCPLQNNHNHDFHLSRKVPVSEPTNTGKRKRHNLHDPEKNSQAVHKPLVKMTPIVTPLNKPMKASYSIVGTRPQHWMTSVTSNTHPGTRNHKAKGWKPHDTTKISDVWTTPCSKQSLRYGMVRRGHTRLEPPVAANPSNRFFTPADLARLPQVATLGSGNPNKQTPESEPEYCDANSRKDQQPQNALNTKHKGPWMQKYTQLRASMNVDRVRLFSRISMHDPRKGKQAVDVELLGKSTPWWGHYSVVYGKVDKCPAWIILDQTVNGPGLLRVYNAIHVDLDPTKQNPIAKVVICTTLHEVL